MTMGSEEESVTQLEMKAIRGEFPGISIVNGLRIVINRKFEKRMRQAHNRGLSVVTDEVWRGRQNKFMWFDEPFNGLWDPGALQAADRMERGPLPEGTIIFDIETRSADEEAFKLLAKKTAFFEEFVGPVEVGCWPPPVSEDLVAPTLQKIDDAKKMVDAYNDEFPEVSRLTDATRYRRAVARGKAAGGRLHTIWAEGYAATGEHGLAHPIGQGYGKTFNDAVRFFFEHDPKAKDCGELRWDNEQPLAWGCRLYNNETDARKAYG